MYSAMSTCQALHPDPEDVDSEEEEFNAYNGEEGEEEEEGNENGQQYYNGQCFYILYYITFFR